MKKISFITILITIFILPVLILANSDSNSPEDVLKEIKTSQNISENSQIKCEKVSDDQFEKIGDAVMGLMHPGQEQHELMDKMMGGEGSFSLKSGHIMMGQRYLNCFSGAYNNKMMGGMMGMPMMMGNNMKGGGYSMMGNFGQMGFFGGYGFIPMILFWGLIIVGIMVLLRWAFQGSDRKETEKSPLEILKERYAKGEIDKKEFEEKKKDLD